MKSDEKRICKETGLVPVMLRGVSRSGKLQTSAFRRSLSEYIPKGVLAVVTK